MKTKGVLESGNSVDTINYYRKVIIRKLPLYNALYYFLTKNEYQMKSQFNCLNVSQEQLFLHSKKHIYYRH